ncbi:hypothetical protein EYF80_011463 [Liparis tanakae]|uniref:Uncharacterized protein n=1 Tax=Liparis tanakae TaxID=230148 RepID=A0A4Z2IM48_9TELE|nr:hypothetical protein EYF80_011463 [Liparis tanakae]
MNILVEENSISATTPPSPRMIRGEHAEHLGGTERPAAVTPIPEIPRPTSGAMKRGFLPNRHETSVGVM